MSSLPNSENFNLRFSTTRTPKHIHTASREGVEENKNRREGKVKLSLSLLDSGKEVGESGVPPPSPLSEGMGTRASCSFWRSGGAAA